MLPLSSPSSRYGAQSCCGCLFHPIANCLPSRLPVPEALRSILHTNKAFLYAITRFGPSEPAATKTAFARVFRAVAAACAALVGPAHGVSRVISLPVREDAKLVQEYHDFFQVRTLSAVHHEAPSASAQLLRAVIRPPNYSIVSLLRS